MKSEQHVLAIVVVLALVALMVGLTIRNAYGGTAYYLRERISGLNKICYYNHLGSEVAITIKSIQLCPVTINVP